MKRRQMANDKALSREIDARGFIAESATWRQDDGETRATFTRAAAGLNFLTD